MESGPLESCEMFEFKVIRGADDHDEEAAEDGKDGNYGNLFAQMVTDEEPREFSAESDKLSEVQQLVDELVVFGRELQFSPQDTLELPEHTQKIQQLMSKEGLGQLSDRNRQEARLRILGALGLCLKNVRYISVWEMGDIIGETELTISEVEALCRPLEASMVLTYLDVDDSRLSQCFKPENAALWADILYGAKMLKGVIIGEGPWPSVLSGVVKAVASSGRGPLHIQDLQVHTEHKLVMNLEGRRKLSTTIALEVLQL